MKLYTRPRVIPALFVRLGDELAIDTGTDEPIGNPAELVAADLDGIVSWVTVLSVSDDDERPDGAHGTAIAHTRGTMRERDNRRVFVREPIELDPLTYVRTISADPLTYVQPKRKRRATPRAEQGGHGAD